jgi:hypothetical protein
MHIQLLKNTRKKCKAEKLIEIPIHCLKKWKKKAEIKEKQKS